MKNTTGKPKKGRRILAALMALMMTVMTFAPYQLGFGIAYGEEEQTQSELGAAPSQQAADQNDEQQPAAAEQEKAVENDSTVNDAENNAENTEVPSDNDAKAANNDDKQPVNDAENKNEKAKDDKDSKSEKDSKANSELSFKGKDFEMSLSYDSKADLPDSTKLKVEDIEKNNARYDALYENAVKALQPAGKKDAKTLSFVKFYDIKLTNDGKEIEPSAAVNVDVDFASSLSNDMKAENENHVKIVHLKETDTAGKYKTEVLANENVDPTIKNDRLTETSFKADSFSVYAVVYTVDFHFGNYSYSINGEDSIMLSELFDKLKIDIPAGDIQNATFSDPSLVKVEKVTGSDRTKDDWKLTSLKPFKTYEKLTLDTLYGQIVIDVTDEVKSTDVCKIGDQGYPTLKAAVDAVPIDTNTTIEMLKDAELSSNLSIATNKKITFTTSSEYTGNSEDGHAVIRRASSSFNSSMFTTKGNVTFKNITIDGRDPSGTMVKGPSNGGLVNASGGKLVLENGAVLQYGHAGSEGGGIYIQGSCDVVMKDGAVIQDCRADRNTHYAGGGVCIVGGKRFVMEGGTIRRCSAPEAAGGAIGVDHGDYCLIMGGTITECTAKERGSAIEIHGNIFMTGGLITNNTTTDNDAGAVNFYSNVKNIFLSGSPRIIGNFDKDGNAHNLDIYNHAASHGATDKCIIVSDFTNPNAGDGTFKTGINTKFSDYDFSANKFKGLDENALMGVSCAREQNKIDAIYGIYHNGVRKDTFSCFVCDNDPSQTLVGADYGENKLSWSRGFRVKAKMYFGEQSIASAVAHSIEIKGSDGRYAFDYGDTSESLTDRSITSNHLAIDHQTRMKYLPMADTDPQHLGYMFAAIDDQTDSLLKIKGQRSITKSGTKRTIEYKQYYDTNKSTDNPLDANSTANLYYRIDPVCKLTDGSGNILYLESGNPALFAKLDTAFKYIGKAYKYKGIGENKTLEHYTGNDYQVKMLVSSYSLNESITVSGNYNVTLTTEKQNTVIDAMSIPGADNNCVISRASGFSSDYMIKTKLNQLKLDKVVIDGKNVSSSGGIASVTGGTLVVANAELKNSDSTVNGGAINAASSATVKVQSGADINNCSSSSYGGAIYSNGATIDLAGGNISSNHAGADGGGIYAAGSSKVNVQGSPYVYGNTSANSIADQKRDDLNDGGDSENNWTIYVTGDLGDAAKIGVYSDNRSDEGNDFARYSGAQKQGFGRFVNDKNTNLTGVNNNSSTGYVKWPALITLTVANTVTGNYASYNQPFEFHIGVDGKTASDMLSCVKKTSNGEELTGDDQQREVAGLGGIFKLTHNQKIEIRVPENAKITVTETQQEGYLAPEFAISGNGAGNENGEVTNGLKFHVGEADATLNVINEYNDASVVPSGLPEKNNKLLILLGLVITCAALILREFLMRPRRAA